MLFGNHTALASRCQAAPESRFWDRVSAARRVHDPALILQVLKLVMLLDKATRLRAVSFQSRLRIVCSAAFRFATTRYIGG